jgi:hypothetical protein
MAIKTSSPYWQGRGGVPRKGFSMPIGPLQTSMLKSLQLCVIRSDVHGICQTEGLGKEDAELLVYLVDEEIDIYIGVLVVVCHLGSIGRVFSTTSE